ncbi:hypothetical protein F5Y14DRAFT_100681 [Nemania sp. NC0429]|nr:hypothetical protein F5Y14DRAFT_100681 [Nemania sp. NC0429]
MLRIGSTRCVLQTSSRAVFAPKRHIPILAPNRCAANPRIPRAVSAHPAVIVPWTSFATKTPTGFQRGIDTEEEKKLAQRKLAPHPESVTTESSVRHLYEPSAPDRERPPRDALADDLKTVQDTFSLSGAPKEPYWLGVAGTLPYLGTSVSTIYLAWVLNTPWPSSSTFANNLLIDQERAAQLLATLEPIQLGYGAIIISFLGAVHWGLEYAEKAPDQIRTRFRYGIGVMAPIIAWPTLFLPVEFALTGQFAAFVALYFADARATVRGWAPAWYSTYRFVLTAIVGVAIAISLIGRAKVGDARPQLSGLGEKFHQHAGEEEYTQKWRDLEQKERSKIEKQKKKEEEEEKEKEKEKEKQEETKGKGQGREKEQGKKKEQGKGNEPEKENEQGKDKEQGTSNADESQKQDGKKEESDKK